MGNFTEQWRDFQRALSVHMQLEDKGLFPLLDSVGNSAVTEAGLRDEHINDLKLREAVDKAIKKDDDEALKRAFDAWSEDHLAHLTHEEEVMMPIIPHTGKNCIEHGQIVNQRLLSMAQSIDEFDWALAWILDNLGRANSTNPPAEMMVRVFVWGLHYSADENQWQRWLPIVKKSVSSDIYQQMVSNFRIDRPGRVGAVRNIEEEFGFLGADSPKPVPFAVMRNTHEALRASINEMNELLKAA
jgi:iron-sulfur cluster repair protein YtfE (RIC family)